MTTLMYLKDTYCFEAAAKITDIKTLEKRIKYPLRKYTCF